MTLHSNPGARRRVPMRAAALTAAGLSAALVLSACGASPSTPGGDGEFQKGGTLNIGIASDPGSLDPILAAGVDAITVRTAFCETLYQIYGDAGFVPVLASALPEVSDDRLTITIPLRDDAVFADGSPFNAEAVKFGLDRNRAENSNISSSLAPIESVDVVDEFTVQLNLTRALSGPAVETMLAQNDASAIVSMEAVETLGDDGFNAAPVCVGAFKYESRIAQDSITLVRDELYYDADNVHLDSIVFRAVPDASVRATNLRSGDLDLVVGVGPIDAAAIEADPDLAVYTQPDAGFHGLFFNHGNVDGDFGNVDTPFAQDVRVRLALAKAIDQEAFSNTVFQGAYPPACGFVQPTHPLLTDAMQECIGYDPEGARDLLEETGLALPIRGEIMADQRAEFRRGAEVIQAMAAEVGFELEISVVDDSTRTIREDSGDFDIAFISKSGRADPTATISWAVQSTHVNFMKYRNAEMDAYFDLAGGAKDEAETVEAWEGMSRLINEDVAIVYTVRPNLNIGHAANVSGIRLTGGQGALVAKNVGFLAD